MKKVFLTLMAVSLAMGAMAVELPKQGFGVQLGWAQPIIRLNSPDPTIPKDSLANTVHLNGFKVGLTYDASYVAGFGSSIGVNYTFGYSQGKWEPRFPTINQYPRDRMLITYHQLELFIDWQYKFEIAKETYLMLYTGPSLQCGLELSMRNDTQTEDFITGEVTTNTGEWMNAYKADAKQETQKGAFITADNALRRLNITWGVGAGFQYKRYFLRGGYDFGLINPYDNASFTMVDRRTRGRIDQWNIKLGIYLWYHE